MAKNKTSESKEIVIKGDASLHNEEWYQQLVDDCKAIQVERFYNAGIEIIQGNWELGQRISKENDNMERTKVYGKKVIESLSADLGKSESHLWKCVQVYKYYDTDDFDTLVTRLPEGKNVNWTLAVKGAGIEKKEEGVIKEKTSFKLDAIVSAFKIWLVSKGTVDEDEILKAINEFKETLKNND